MSTEANNTTQSNEIPDIAAEQAALAASLAHDPSAVATTTQPATTQTETSKAPETSAASKASEDLTPAAKQALLADDAGEITLDAFEIAKGKKAPATDAKAAKPATTPTPVATTEATAQTGAAALPAVRDVTTLPTEYHEVAKKMSNEAFTVFGKLVGDNKSLAEQLTKAKSGAIPDSYYEHEQAYVLTPAFEKASDAVTRAEQILNHWAAQSDALAAGADSYTGLAIDAQGQLVQTAPIKADRATANQVSRTVSAAQNQYMQAQAALQSVGQVHRAQVAETKNWLTQFEQQAFKVFSDKPELATLATDTQHKILHKSLQSNVLAPAFAKAVVLLDMQARALQQLQAGKTGAATPATNGTATTPTAQPSAAAIAGGGVATTNGKMAEGEVTMDDFLNRKKGIIA